ncbi:MAG: hypothetical protein NT075_01280 [Chloroflexi bacterium]|nr:hypothetical protein [Chloroflexota bacterium]
MSHAKPVSTVTQAINAQEINVTFVVRLTWDSLSDHWRILIKPTNGEDARLFSDVESALLHLEAVMSSYQQSANQ